MRVSSASSPSRISKAASGRANRRRLPHAVSRAQRLDLELVRRGLVRSRSEAKQVIDEGKVKVKGMPLAGPASLVREDAAITLTEARRFVSRGGDKLDGALERLGIEVTGRRWLDAGASTGGFTDRLLQGGAAGVVAVDVGYGQLDWGLRNDPRVTVLERQNIRLIEASRLPWVPEGVVADLSFISLAKVLPDLARMVSPDADFLLLVKPQFEAGREFVGKGGVVRDPAVWLDSLRKVAAAGRTLDLGVAGATRSEPPGPAGNREFFLHLRRGVAAAEAVMEWAVGEVST